MITINIEDIQKAKQRIEPYINKTPIIYSNKLNKWLGHEIYFKAECFQKVGAFKSRGACNTISWLVENKMKPDHIVSNSSGNHAQAVAWAASKFGISSSIYMPENVSKVKAQATSSYGAEIIFCKNRTIVDEKTELASKEQGTYWVPPFNHPQVIAGQGTAVLESLDELDNVDAIFAPCGGGGLLSGSLITARALATKTKVIGAEPKNANDAAESIMKNSIQILQTTPDTIADGARTLSVGEITFQYLKKLDEFYEIEEDEIIYWTQWLSHLLKVRVEPTSAMPMEAVKKWLSKQKSKKRVLVVISGGNIDMTTMNKIWSKDYLNEIPSLTN
ncbi:MAG: serine/threonine dehydratase [Ignavibacteria bacterium]|nr:serine/threonine dehydratase [Ignavibacteria bacterium]